ncbi:MAG: glutaminyl-peptide cyclotransferase, partial [Anaerolinea sp.]|nr:glutaminyl-peptide cyclotransferase [Anaerolinea sp.]
MRRGISILLFALFIVLPVTVPAAARTATVAPPTPTPAPETTAEARSVEPIPIYAPEVINTYPHDTSSFTQGLVWSDGTLYESAGRYGQSNLREVDLTTGAVIRSVPVSEAYFAEGLALVDDRLIQITWREGTAFVYDAPTFDVIEQFSYEGEGWGLCYDGVDLWMSDGTPNLFRRDLATFALLETIPVTLFDEPIANLNELECVDGHV